jgi:hypothetical protein
MTPRASRVMTAVCLLVIAGATPPARVAAQAMAPTSLPQTPAGRTLKEFLESFNAGTVPRWTRSSPGTAAR